MFWSWHPLPEVPWIHMGHELRRDYPRTLLRYIRVSNFIVLNATVSSWALNYKLLRWSNHMVLSANQIKAECAIWPSKQNYNFIFTFQKTQVSICFAHLNFFGVTFIVIIFSVSIIGSFSSLFGFFCTLLIFSRFEWIWNIPPSLSSSRVWGAHFEPGRYR